jgi:hypothetical protein
MSKSIRHSRIIGAMHARPLGALSLFLDIQVRYPARTNAVLLVMSCWLDMQVRLVHTWTRGVLQMISALVFSAGPNSGFGADQPLALEAMVEVLDFCMSLQLQTRPSAGAAAIRASNAVSKGLVASCGMVMLAAKQWQGAKQTLEGPLVHQGLLARWLQAMDLLEPIAAQYLLQLASCMLASDDACTGGALASRSSLSQQAAAKVRRQSHILTLAGTVRVHSWVCTCMLVACGFAAVEDSKHPTVHSVQPIFKGGRLVHRTATQMRLPVTYLVAAFLLPVTLA